MKRKAVVLLNLGAPDSLNSVQPFLFNLFNDPAIIPLSKPVRFVLAKALSHYRNSKAQKIYQQIGGKSPLLVNTLDQANALEEVLGSDYKVFVCMRYWHPQIAEVMQNVQKFNPDEIILLPLYPQYSSTTTGSAFSQWLSVPTKQIYSYPINKQFIKSIADKIIIDKEDSIVLFTAHGIPESLIKKGDPYQREIEATVNAILQEIKIDNYVICYQSRIGPKKWLTPYADKEIIKYAQLKKNIIVVPISFVSEHCETLVELDIEYRNLALGNGAKSYIRISTQGTCPIFMKGLAELVKECA